MPTWRAVAVTPAFAPFMALTTEARDPLPTETFCAVIVPTLRGPERSAVIVPPVPEVRVTCVVPVAPMLETVFAVPSTFMIPFVPYVVDPAVIPSEVKAVPPVICREALDPCCAVAIVMTPDELTDAVKSPPLDC